MAVPGVIFASEAMLPKIFADEAPVQVRNAACLPGILGHSIAMPDIHWGYGLPIGGVIATDIDEGVISPGGVGADINCGVRLVRTNLVYDDVQASLKTLVQSLYKTIPCGVGSAGKIVLSRKNLRNVLIKGSKWAVQNGYGWNEDTDYTEDNGCLEGASDETLSKQALERGKNQLGTLGSGNHFLEIQVIDKIIDTEIAHILNLHEGQLCVMIHSGSRGLGYQVSDDYIRQMDKAAVKYHINLPDRQLACTPFRSPEGRAYLSAMRSAANYAYANRQCIMHWVREVFAGVFGLSAEQLGMHLLYDVTHNTAKVETHKIHGRDRQVIVHRKGATRSLPQKHPDVPVKYSGIGQPVLVPGSMGSHSYVLVGNHTAMEHSFGSTCHGAGRVMSRRQAVKNTKGRSIERELADQGIIVISRGKRTLKEECPEAYKDVSEVVRVVHDAGLSKQIVRLRPVGVVKG